MMSHHLFYRQANALRVSSHPTQPVVTEDAKDAHLQHQVSIKTHRPQTTSWQHNLLPIMAFRSSNSVHTCWWRHMCTQRASHILPSRLQGWTGLATAGLWATLRQAEPAAWPHLTTGSWWRSHHVNFAGGPVGREFDPKTSKKQSASSVTRWCGL